MKNKWQSSMQGMGAMLFVPGTGMTPPPCRILVPSLFLVDMKDEDEPSYIAQCCL